MRVGGNGGNPKKAESHLRRSESTQGAPGVQGGLFGVQEGAVGSQEVAGKWRCMNDFSQKVEDFSRFFEIGSFRPWRRRRWSRLAERSPKPVSPTKTDKGKWVSDDTRKIRRFSRRTSRPGYWPVTHPGPSGIPWTPKGSYLTFTGGYGSQNWSIAVRAQSVLTTSERTVL